MEITQLNRMIAISTPLGGDVLLLRVFQGTEAISSGFHFTLDLLSENDAIDFSLIVGKNVTVRIACGDGTSRYWNGYISQFTQKIRETVLTAYRAEMIPWMWFLTLRTDSRIFQNMKAPQIIEDVFIRAGFHDFEWRVEGDFRLREYCVQYQETDFAFVSRLLEDEGIFYFFEHDNGKHTLVLADQTSAHRECPGQPTAYYAHSSGGLWPDDRMIEWSVQESFRTSCVTLNDYNFKEPEKNLAVSVDGDNPFEFHRYPGGYTSKGEGGALAEICAEELHAGVKVGSGKSVCRAFRAGYRFALQGHYRSDFNQSYILTKVQHSAIEGGYDVGAGMPSKQASVYSNEVGCIPSSVLFRPQQRTIRKLIEGCQTATVVGPQDEEIFTDEFGRVKVQFHWDRVGASDEKSSCWIRVAQSWAGKGWGAIMIPCTGQEVVVDFLEGNPDRPIIVGSVYNADQTPPYALPDEKTKSTLKSNSSKGSGGFNELRFEDAKGQEQIFLHAERNQ